MSKNTKQFIADLDRGVKELFSSQRWQDYLTFLSKFHHYSVNNTIAIFMQRPTATRVASFTDWQTKFGRQIRKGEKGIRIIAPHTYKDIDPDTGEEKQYLAFHLTHCFDVSQTTGKPLPQHPARNLVGNLDNFAALRDAITAISPAPISYKPLADGVHGCYDTRSGEITICTGLGERQTIKTLLHEIAHAHLHSQGGEQEKADQFTREVQAESVAYVVCRYLDIDSSAYSFGYIAGWSHDKTLPELKSSIEAISKAADAMITDLENMNRQKGVA